MDTRLRAAERSALTDGTPAARARTYVEWGRVGDPTPEFRVGCWLEAAIYVSGPTTLYRVVHAESRTQQCLRLTRLPLSEASAPYLSRMQTALARRMRIKDPRVPAVLAHGETTAHSGETLHYVREQWAPGQTLARVLNAPPPDPREVVPDLPLGLVALLRKGMHKAPATRPSLEGLIAEIDRVLDSTRLPDLPQRSAWLSKLWVVARG